MLSSSLPDGGRIVPITQRYCIPRLFILTAENFDSKRWLNPKDISNSNYLPFYSSSRTCIGNKLALTEFKVLLSMLVRNFVFQPVEGFHISSRIFPVNKPYPRLELNVSRVEV